jgi:hypothetical protein
MNEKLPDGGMRVVGRLELEGLKAGLEGLP